MRKLWCLFAAAAALCLVSGSAFAAVDMQITNITDSPNDVTLGQGNVQYFINIFNASGIAATNAQLTVNLPASSTFVAASATSTTCNHSAGVVTCSWASYPSGASFSATIEVTPGAAGTNTLSANISAVDTDPLPGNNSDTENTTVNDQIDLAVTNITDSPNDITLGQGNVQYFINMYNYSTSKATGTVLTVNLPASSTYVSGTVSVGTCNESGGVVTCTIGDYPSGASYSATITVTPGAAGTNTLSASIAAAQPDPDNVTAGHLSSDTENTTVNDQIDLAVTGITDSPNDITLGQGNVQYFINMYNYSTSKATGTVLTVNLPASSTYVSGTVSVGTCNESGGVVTCTIGDYPSGASYSATITVTPGAAGTNTLTASIAAAQPDPDNVTAGHLSSDTENTTVNDQIDLAVTGITDSPNDITLNTGNVQYFINMYNYSTSKATNTVLTVNLPASSTYVSGTVSVGSCSHSAGVVTCTIGDYPSGASYSATITVTPGAAGTNTLSASIAATQPDPDNVTAGHLSSDTENTTVNDQIDLAVTGITDSPNDITLNTGNVQYFINMYNYSTSKATGTVLTVNLPASSTYVSGTVSVGSCSHSAGVVTCTIGDYPSGASYSATITVTPGAAGTNTLSASIAATQPDPDNVTAGHLSSDTENTTVNDQIDLAVTGITDSPNDITLGQGNVQYFINMYNYSTSKATNTVLTVNLPASSTYVSGTVSVGSCSHSAGVVTCTIGDYPSGASYSATITITPGASGTNTLTASIAATQPDPDNVTAGHQVNDSEATTVNSQIDLAITGITDSPDPRTLGAGNVQYFINMFNYSSSKATNTVLTVNLPASSGFVSATVSVGSCSHSAGVVTCTIGDYPSGASYSATITVTPGVAGNNVLSASMTATQSDPDEATAFHLRSDTETTLINPSSAPTITGFSPGSGAVNTPVTLSGANFTGTTSVKFNGVTASFTAVNDSTITTNVPSGATTGVISVTNGIGTTSSAASFTVTAGIVVINTNDTGTGSLRDAITKANTGACPSPCSIGFSIGSGLQTINVLTNLPSISVANVTIDATTQPGWSGAPIVELVEASSGPSSSAQGLVLAGGGATVRGLVMRNWANGATVFPFGYAIYITSSNNTVAGCYLGTNATGSAADGNRVGVVIDGAGRTNNTIGGLTANDRNVISGNTASGVSIENGPTGNFVVGNYIGTDATGTFAIPNAFNGVNIEDANNNTIGGTSAAARNVISGNGSPNVNLWFSAAGNTVQGNYIGTNAAGTVALVNGSSGINIEAGGAGETTSGNFIGGFAAGAGNLVSGNAANGIMITGSGTNTNVVHGNVVGLNAAGTSAIANAFAGIYVSGGAQSNAIGGITAGAGNVVSGNTRQGIAIEGSGTNNNQVQGNYIGINPSGSTAIPNAWTGIGIWGGAQSNTIGGTSPSARNVISGNSQDGVAIRDSATSFNTVAGNYIGTDATGSFAVANNWYGVDVFAGATSNTIGGASASSMNLISGNSLGGVLLTDSGTSANSLLANHIGLNAAASGAISNAGPGVLVNTSAAGNTIGSTAAPNKIAFNNKGVVLTAAAGTANRISGNAMASNTGIGIDLKNDGVTPNDLTDGDTGPNNVQNYPVINSATLSAGTSLDVTLTIDSSGSSPGLGLQFEIFKADASSPEQGFTYLGTTPCTGPTLSSASYNFTVAGIVPGNKIVATATSFLDGTCTTIKDGTSEFSAAATVVQGQAAVSISKSAPANVAASETFNYVLTVTNTGPYAAENVSVSDTLPAGLVWNSTTASGWSCSAAPNVTCTRSSLPGGSSTITFNVTAPSSPTSVNNTAMLSATNDSTGGDNSSNAVTTVNAASADLGVTKSSNLGTIPAGGSVTYTITVQNFGPSPASSVVMTDALPPGQSATTATSTQGTCTTGTTVTCTIGAMANGATVTITVVATANAGGTFVNSATKSAAEGDPNSTNDTGFASVVVTGSNTLTVTTAADSGNGSLRQAITDANGGVCIAPCTINFAVSPLAPIVLATPLPAVNVTATINGATQSGWSGIPLIHVDGSSCAGCNDGLTFNAGQSILKALEVSGFPDAGIVVGPAATGVRILEVVTDANGGLGIDLGNDGPTANDAGDSDNGANNLQNKPVLNSAVLGSGTLFLDFSVDSASILATNSLRIDFYKSDGANEGVEPLGWVCYAGRTLTNQTFTTSPGAITAGTPLTATATSFTDGTCTTPSDGTSEFAAPINVTNCTPPAATITAPLVSCSSAAGQNASVPFTAGATYAWSISNGAITGGAGTNAITFTAGASGTTTLSIIVTHNGCNGTDSVNVTIVPPPTATVSGTTAVCPGGSATISASLTGTAPFNLMWSDGFPQTISSGTTASRSVTPGSSTTYTITSISDANCTGTSSGSATVNVTPTPTATVSGTNAVCAGASATITATLIGTAPFSLLWSDGFPQTVSSGTVASRTVTPASTTTYTVTSFSDASCTGTTSGSATITVNPLPAVNITGPTATCASTPVTLDAGPGFVSYLWTPGGATTQQITVSPASTTTYNVTVTDTNSCSAGDSHTVTVSANPTAAIAAPPSVCASSAGNSASVAAQFGATYAWTIGNGAFTSATNTPNVTFTAGAAGTVTLGVTVTVGSCTSTGNANVPINPNPNVTITGPTSVCPNATFTLDAGPGFTSYQWSTGQTTQSISVTQSAASATYSVVVTDINGCSATDSHVVNLSAAPDATIAAPPTVQPNSTGNLASAPAQAGAAYTWLIGNGTITAGSGTNAITFSAGASGTLTLTLQVTLSGCTSSSSINIPIGSQPTGADFGVLKTAAGNVQAGSSLTYTILVSNAGPANGSATVTDTLPAGVAFNSVVAGGVWSCAQNAGTVSCSGPLAAGASNTIVINTTAPQQAGTITNSASVSSADDPNPSNNASSATTQITARPTVCASTPPSLLAPANNATVTSPVTFSWTAVDGATTYELWLASNGNTLLAGTTANTTLTLQVPSGASSWFIVARLGSGCDALVSAQRTFTVTESGNCSQHGVPQITSPAPNAIVASPVPVAWTPVPQAIGYRVWIEVNGTAPQDVGTTDGAITLSAQIPPGAIQLYVDALFGGCPPTRSARLAFTVPAPDPCANRGAPSLVAPANNATLQTSSIELQWNAAPNASEHRVWASINGGTPAVLGTTTNNSLRVHIADGEVIWWVQALYDGCAPTESPRFRFTVPPRTNCGNARPEIIAPANGAVVTNGEVTFQWSGVEGATGYDVYLAVANGTAALIGSTAATSLTHDVPAGELEWSVVAHFDRCPDRESQKARFVFDPPPACENNQRAILVSPLDSELTTAPASFAWHAPAGATRFELYAIRGSNPPVLLASTTGESAPSINLATGKLRWFVRSFFAQGCAPLDSEVYALEIAPAPSPCSTLAAPVITAPGEISSGIEFLIQWNSVLGATGYQLQIASNAAFSGAELISTSATSHALTRTNNTNAPLAVFARVRAIDGRCTPVPSLSPYGPTSAIFILPQQGTLGSMPLGESGIVNYTINLGPEFAGQTFTAASTEPWLTVTPLSGVVAAGGTALHVQANTAGLGVGANTGAIAVTLNSSSARLAANATTTVSSPVTVNLVTPVTPAPKNTPPPDALIIPAVANADGINAHFQSDVRLSNTSPQLIKYQLTFIPAGDAGITAGRQTQFSVEPGRTVALDDVLKSWFGTGTASAQGSLEIRPLTQTSTSTSSAAIGALANLVSFASSRTFNVTPNGTFGQYIPAIPFANFLGKASDASKKTVLSLQQIAQSAKYRTNLGLVEGSGEAASLLIKVFGSNGQQLTSFPVNLNGGQQTQLNAFLAQHGLTLEDGRVEVEVTSGNGKITAYASVLDNETADAILVTPVSLADAGNTKWVVPGVADVKSGFADWQTDMRVFNADANPAEITATFYSQNLATPPATTKFTLAAGEVKQLDKTLSALFNITGDGGALHLSTPSAARLIATARTYNQTSKGTYGQFISAVTPAEAVGVGSRPLQLLQVEESSRFRSNIGFAEVTGKPVKLEVTITPPDAKFSATTTLDLAANEYRQIGSMLKGILGPNDVFNARISVRAIGGQGRATAYASVIDLKTNDPTYNPAQ